MVALILLVAFASGPHWRHLREMCIIELLSKIIYHVDSNIFLYNLFTHQF